jgi:IS5 family transposase
VKLVETAPTGAKAEFETKDVSRPEVLPSSRPGRARSPQAIAPETFEPPTPTSQTFEAIDRALHAAVGRLSHGVSPIVLARAYGLARCTWRGLHRFRAYVWSAVVAYNLALFARLKPA